MGKLGGHCASRTSRDLHTAKEQQGQYLAFLGRISPEKRVDRAIEVARRAGMPIKIAAKIDSCRPVLFRSQIGGFCVDPLVEYVGEISESEKTEFLGNAYALLFLIDWQEPFGLVMTEAMACGTPVIAYRMGSVPEVIEDGVTGYIVDNLDDAAEAVGRIPALDRRKIRRVFENRFSARRMCHDYIEIFRRIGNGEPDSCSGDLALLRNRSVARNGKNASSHETRCH